MLDFSDIFKDMPFKPWLLVGKGPTFQRVHYLDLSEYNVIAINHAATKIPSDFASFVDIDVYRNCAREVNRMAKHLLTPYTPHLFESLLTGERTVPEKTKILSEILRNPELERLNEEDRLCCYHCQNSKIPGLVARGRHFSSSVLFSLLAIHGVVSIRSVGIDGGTEYDAAFSNVTNYNKQFGYDHQFPYIASIVLYYGLDYKPL